MDASSFLSGGGEMGHLTRTYDWAASPLGPIEQWPGSLLTTLSILLNSKFPMFLWWGNDLIQFYNDAYCPSLGVKGRHPSALGQKGKDCWPEIWPTIYPLIKQVLDGGDSVWFEDSLIPIYRNGQLEDVYWTFSYSPVKGNDGSIEGVLVVCTETTQSILNFKKLREAEASASNTAQRLELALAAAHLGSFEYVLATGEVTCNVQCLAHFGISTIEHITSSHFLAAILPEDRYQIEQAWNQAIIENATYNDEYRVLWPDGKIRWLRGVGNPVFHDNGEPWKIVGVTIDITEQKLFTQELAKEVYERTLELQRSNDDLQQFAHITSHDLKEPVRKILIWTERLNDECRGQLTEKGKFYLGRLRNNTERIKIMIDSILTLSLASSTNQRVNKVDLNELLRQVEIDLEMLIEEKAAVIHSDELPTVEGAKVLLFQLFYNLIINSLKFSKENEAPIIHITSQVEHIQGIESAIIKVSDNGIGFDSEYNASIFLPFTRLNSKDNYEGSGLGLALCRKIVHRHGGTIFSDGQEGKGATFTVVLPLSQANRTGQDLLLRNDFAKS